MKGLVVLFILGVAGGIAILFIVKHMSSDQGELIAYAVGNPDGDSQELHVVLYGHMTNLEPPKVDFNTGFTHWDEWIKDHFEVKDGGGGPVEFYRRSQSSLIPDKKAGGTPDSYLVGKVRKGATYTFDYIPVKSQAKRYHHEFSVPADGIPLTRVTFKLVK